MGLLYLTYAMGKKVSVKCRMKFSFGAQDCEVVFSIQWLTFGLNTAPGASLYIKHTMWMGHLIVRQYAKC